MNNKKRMQLHDHIFDSSNITPTPQIHYAGTSDRLSKSYHVGDGSWKEVADDIDVLGTHWFPDANVFFNPEAEIVWEKFRKNAIILGRPQAIITETVAAEIQDWLSDPHHLQERASKIRSAVEQQTWLGEISCKWKPEFTLSLLGYVRTLAIRRTLALATPDGTTLLGTDPNDTVATMKEIGRRLGPRAQGLARKGRKEMEKRGQISVNDELHCLLAILHALVKERETVILTTDVDCLEIFQKLFWFIDSHYRAMLAADQISKGRFGNPIATLINHQGYFAGPVTLYRRVTNEMKEVLPDKYRSVPISVIFISPNGKVHRFGCQFETSMLKLLRVKSRTNGRCTEALNAEQNVHIDLGPLKSQYPGLCLGVGIDKGDSARLLDQDVFRSRLDAENALQCNETTTQINHF